MSTAAPNVESSSGARCFHRFFFSPYRLLCSGLPTACFFLFCSGHPTAYCAAVTLPLVFLWLFLSVFFGIVVFCLCLFFGYNGLSATITQVGSAAVAAGPSLAAWGNG